MKVESIDWRRLTDGWSPVDFLLRSEFCPPGAIRPVLDRLRRDVGADAALLLVAGSRGLLRTLCCYAGDEGQVKTVEDFLWRGPRVRRLVLRRASTRLPGDGSVRVHGDPKWRADAVLSRLTQVALRHERTDVLAALGSAAEWSEVEEPEEMNRMPLTVAAFVRRPSARSHRSADQPPAVAADEDMLALGMMVSASANANVHRDTMITTRVDEKLDPEMSPTGEVDLTMGPRRLVELAAEVTESDATAYYRIDPVDGVLRRVATHPVDAAFPAEIAADSRAAAAVAVKRRRLVSRDPRHTRIGIETTLRSADTENRFAETATPVPGPLASPRASCTGVLTVLRGIGGSANSYAAYDHALLRNVALRLALLHAAEDMEAAAEMFRDLTIRNSSGPALVEAPTALVQDAATDILPPIPEDVAVALPAIRTALGEIARLTNSHSATFRLAHPSTSTSAPQGLVLVRVAAHSKEGLADPRPVQDLSEPGINCRTALTGTVQNVPFAHEDSDYDEVRPGTRSQISAPVTLEGLVVAVVNLESPVERNYDARVSTVIAFAEHVGMVLADARLALSRPLHRYATQIVTRAHDLSAEARPISLATAGSPPFVRRTVERAIERIETGARGIADFDPDGERRDSTTMPVLASEAWKRAELLHLVREIEDRPWHPFDKYTSAFVFDCLRHVFVNVQGHMPIAINFPPEVRVTNAVWGGRRYDILTVRNEAKDPIDPARAVNLYRVPVVDSEPRSRADGAKVKLPRFGAYLAGSQARAVGGDVHLALEDEEVVRVTVMIPEPIGGVG